MCAMTHILYAYGCFSCDKEITRGDAKNHLNSEGVTHTSGKELADPFGMGTRPIDGRYRIPLSLGILRDATFREGNACGHDGNDRYARRHL
jgi:hypothetical protein